MSTMLTTMKEWQERYLKTVARVEEPVVRFTGKAAESVVRYVPERPDWAFLDSLPTMTEFVENQLKFRKQIVDEQAAFARKLIKAMHPALVKLETKAPAAKRVETKPAARRVGVKAA